MNSQVLEMIKLTLQQGTDITNSLIRETLNYFLIINCINALGWLVALGITFKLFNVGIKYCNSCAETSTNTDSYSLNKFWVGILSGARALVCLSLMYYFILDVKPAIKIAVAPKLFLIELVQKEIGNK
jgi:hypothetical protein